MIPHNILLEDSPILSLIRSKIYDTSLERTWKTMRTPKDNGTTHIQQNYKKIQIKK